MYIEWVFWDGVLDLCIANANASPYKSIGHSVIAVSHCIKYL